MKKQVLITVLILVFTGSIVAQTPDADYNYPLNDADSSFDNNGLYGGTASLDLNGGSVNYQVTGTSTGDGKAVYLDNSAIYQSFSISQKSQSSVCSWQKLSSDDSSIGEMIVEIWAGSGNHRWTNMFWTDDGTINVHLKGSDGTVDYSALEYNAGANYDLSKYHLYCWTFDSGTAKLYVDSEEKDSFSATYSSLASTTSTSVYLNAFKKEGSGVIGSGDSTMDNTWIWKDDAITKSNIESIYQDGTNNGPSINSINNTPTNPVLNDSVTVEADVTDDTSVSSVTGSYSKDGSTVSSGDSFSNTGGNTWEITDWINVDEADSNYTYTIEATDGDGVTTTETGYFYVNDSSEGLKVAKPKNQTYGTNSVPFDVYLNDDGDDVENESATCSLELDGSQFTSFSLEEGGSHQTGNFNADDGVHNFRASCTEDEGNTSLQNIFREFTVDTGPPNVTIVDPAEGSQTNSTTGIPLNYLIKDEPNLDSSSCQYSKDGGTNFSISSCGNTTVQYGSTGNHNLTVYASDTLGNTGKDSTSFLVDFLNKVTAENKATGSSINSFEVTITNSSKTLGGSTTDGDFEFYTSEMPKGEIEVTVKAEGFQTKNKTFSGVDSSFDQDINFQMERAGFELSVYDEQDNIPINVPVIASIQTDTGTKEFSIGGRYLSSNNVNSPASAFDGDLNTDASDSAGDGQDAELIGVVGVKDGSNTLKVNYECYDEYVPVQMRNVNTGEWDEVGSISAPNGESRSGTETMTFTNDNNKYDGRVRLENYEDFCNVYEVYIDNYETAKYDVEEVPTGKARINVDDIDYYDRYRQRTFLATLDEFSRVNLKAYLLKNGEGITTTIETRDPKNDPLAGSLVNVQRNYGGDYVTVAQAETSSDGSGAFYLDPDIAYRVVATNPGYDSFTGTFNPANYQYDPLLIRLGKANNFTESTEWARVEYKLLPDQNNLNATGQYSFNWSIIDSGNGISEFGIRIRNETGGLLDSKAVSGSPSGGTVQLDFNMSNNSLGQGDELQVNGYFVKDQKEFNYRRTYNIIKRVEAGPYSIEKIMGDFESGSSDTAQSFLALIFTLAIGSGLKSRFDRAGGGIVTLLILGLFTWAGWFNGFFWILTALALVGLYGRRG